MPHPATERAIQAFGEVLRVERELDAKKQKLAAAVVLVPKNELRFYVSETEQMQQTDEELRGKTDLTPKTRVVDVR